MSRPNSEGCEPASCAPPQTHTYTRPDFASDEADGKAFATMQARAARCGCTLHELGDGGFLVGRWGYGKAVPCLRAVGAMLRQIGGR